MQRLPEQHSMVSAHLARDLLSYLCSLVSYAQSRYTVGLEKIVIQKNIVIPKVSYCISKDNFPLILSLLLIIWFVFQFICGYLLIDLQVFYLSLYIEQKISSSIKRSFNPSEPDVIFYTYPLRGGVITPPPEKIDKCKLIQLGNQKDMIQIKKSNIWHVCNQ